MNDLMERYIPDRFGFHGGDRIATVLNGCAESLPPFHRKPNKCQRYDTDNQPNDRHHSRL